MVERIDRTMSGSTTEHETTIRLNMKENITPTLNEVQRKLSNFATYLTSTNALLTSAMTYAGFNITTNFMKTANSMAEISNRIHLVNVELKSATMNMQLMTEKASECRISIEKYAEMYNRMGMAVGHYFTAGNHYGFNPNQMEEVVSRLNKQFQLMHLTPGQYLSVTTSIMDAFELGFFDWRHFKAGMMHDSPLFRGFQDYIGLSGEELQKAIRNHSVTADQFLRYILSNSFQSKVDAQFESTNITPRQFGTMLQNDAVNVMLPFMEAITNATNVVAHWYASLKTTVPGILLFLKALIQTAIVFASIFAVVKIVTVAAAGLAMLFGTIMTLLGSWLIPVILAVGFVFSMLLGYGAMKYHDRAESLKHPTAELGKDPALETNKLLSSIEKDVKGISTKVTTLSKESLNSLIARQEAMTVRSSIQNNVSYTGNYSENDMSKMLVSILRKELAISGVR